MGAAEVCGPLQWSCSRGDGLSPLTRANSWALGAEVVSLESDYVIKLGKVSVFCERMAPAGQNFM